MLINAIHPGHCQGLTRVCGCVTRTQTQAHTSSDSGPITHHNTADLPRGLTLAVHFDHVTLPSKPSAVCLPVPECLHALGSSGYCCYSTALSAM